jgi:hypothetical protein
MEKALSLKSRSKPQLRRALLPLRRMLWGTSFRWDRDAGRLPEQRSGKLRQRIASA